MASSLMGVLLVKSRTQEVFYVIFSSLYCMTVSRKHCTLKSQLLLVNFICPISDLESSFFLGISYICSILYTNCSTLFF